VIICTHDNNGPKGIPFRELTYGDLFRYPGGSRTYMRVDLKDIKRPKSPRRGNAICQETGKSYELPYHKVVIPAVAAKLEVEWPTSALHRKQRMCNYNVVFDDLCHPKNRRNDFGEWCHDHSGCDY